MTVTSDTSYVTREDALEGRITDEDIERARRQIGIPTALRNPQWNPVPDPASISHFAFGYGDDNPLWHDPRYGARTRWNGLIAPPLYPTSAGSNVVAPFEDPEMKATFRGLFRGVGKYYSGVTWEWYRPVRPERLLLTEGRTTVDVQVKQSSFSNGRSVLEKYRQLYVDADGVPLSSQGDAFISAERKGSKEAGKHKARERQHYTPDDIAEIDESYASEVRRGAEPRYFEDVRVGDELGHVTKGPMTVMDIIGWHVGYGFGRYGIGPLRYGWRQRMRMPAFYVEDEFGVPDVTQRLHWDPKWARELGLPAPYDYGEMRTAWLTHLLTNWMGDDAWLWRLETRVVSFNFIGDTHWCRGTVLDKRIEGARNIVDLEVRAENQRGEVTTKGTASVLLPSRERGPVVLPPIPDDVLERGAQMAQDAPNELARDGAVRWWT